MNRKLVILVFGAACLLVSRAGSAETTQSKRVAPDWETILSARVRDYGHRNWIVIADSAYPAQVREGIETIATNESQLTVIEAVLEHLERAQHVRPILYLDKELSYVPESDAAGIEAYRKDLEKLLGNRKRTTLPHEQIIAKLDKAGESFKVLVLKTNLTLPYTSVFFELDCGYWSPEAEARLRNAMKADSK